MIVSVNVALPAPLLTAKGEVRSGIRKLPVQGRVAVRRLGLEGDGQADLNVHGGLDQAVYCYSHDHYAWWDGQLRRTDLTHGAFGENLTLDGMTEAHVRIGDIYRAGTAVLQVTKPRSPCFKLVARMGRPDFQRTFLASGRVGFYCRVLEEGDVAAGDAVERVSTPPDALTVLQDARRLWGAPPAK
jgi:MOSC domain-containing protein YiiM